MKAGIYENWFIAEALGFFQLINLWQAYLQTTGLYTAISFTLMGYFAVFMLLGVMHKTNHFPRIFEKHQYLPLVIVPLITAPIGYYLEHNRVFSIAPISTTSNASPAYFVSSGDFIVTIEGLMVTIVVVGMLALFLVRNRK